MKKSIPVIIALLLMLLICVISCTDANTPDDVTDTADSSSDTTRGERIAYYDPSTTPAYTPVAEADLAVPKELYPEEDMEKDYDNFEITLEKDTYPCNFTTVVMNIKNLNGKYFEIFTFPYIEKWNEETESWELLEYGSSYFAFYNFNWEQCEPEIEFYFHRRNIAQEYKELITPGTYRLQVFVGPEAIYTPTFTVTTEYELDK